MPRTSVETDEAGVLLLLDHHRIAFEHHPGIHPSTSFYAGDLKTFLSTVNSKMAARHDLPELADLFDDIKQAVDMLEGPGPQDLRKRLTDYLRVWNREIN